MTEPNNVTPFRPRPKSRPTAPKGFDVQRPQHKVYLVHGLTLAAFAITWLLDFPFELLGLAAGVAAVMVASANRREGMPWAQTHHEFGLRTILLGGSVWLVVGMLAMLPLVGGLVGVVHLIVLAWVGVRAVAGLIRAFGRKPVPNPLTPLI
jgi:uncharacterized membrane protein